MAQGSVILIIHVFVSVANNDNSYVIKYDLIYQLCGRFRDTGKPLFINGVINNIIIPHSAHEAVTSSNCAVVMSSNVLKL